MHAVKTCLEQRCPRCRVAAPPMCAARAPPMHQQQLLRLLALRAVALHGEGHHGGAIARVGLVLMLLRSRSRSQRCTAAQAQLRLHRRTRYGHVHQQSCVVPHQQLKPLVCLASLKRTAFLRALRCGRAAAWAVVFYFLECAAASKGRTPKRGSSQQQQLKWSRFRPLLRACQLSPAGVGDG